PAASPTALPPAAWTVGDAQGVELLARLVQVDTRQPTGREEPAAQVLRDFLLRAQVEAEVIALSSGRASLFARVNGGAPSGAAPLVLLSHLDTHPFDAEAWPRESGPLSAAIAKDALWGRGTLDGKGLAALHALVLAALEAGDVKLDRPVLMVAAAGGLDAGQPGLTKVLERHPELGNAFAVLTKGGGTRLDLLEDGRVAHTVATSERGYARLHLTAVTRSDERADTGDHATRRLNEALTAVLARGFPPRLTRPTLDTLEAASEGAGFPRSLVFRTTPLARVFLLQEWALRPPTQPLVRDEVVVTQVTSGLAGGQGAADRGHAVLEARLLPGTTPGRMRDLLRARIKDPDVHLVVEDGANWSGSKADPQVLLRIAERAHVPGVSEQVVLPIMNPEPLGARPFRDQEIPVYGFLPYALDEADLARIKGRDERLPLDDYRRGFRVLTGLVIDLTAAPAEKSSRP
ncbi:MAG: M20/M25/M40 family metallo-hydrolase, partial [Deltaproteobacteria bacterium]|nr:M20/M25/M40 family metallo-hydrolase [Deltaproteobacteria bacterium]